MRRSEWIAFVYFLYLAAACWLRPVPAMRRARLTIGALVSAAAIWVVAHAGVPTIVRDWAPLAYLLAGYYLCGDLFVAPSPAIESWLLSWDRRLLGDPTTAFAGWPRAVLAYFEIVYMGCFLLPPAGFAVLAATGHAALADRYWTLVIAAEFGSFGPLAFVQTRPPWAIERRAVLSDRVVHRLADRMVQHLTIGANTFPSGHVAGSLAVALAVWSVNPTAGLFFAWIAASIAVACVAGRYHYVIDAVAGALLAVALRLIL